MNQPAKIMPCFQMLYNSFFFDTNQTDLIHTVRRKPIRAALPTIHTVNRRFRHNHLWDMQYLCR